MEDNPAKSGISWQGEIMFLFIFGLFVGCSLGVFLTSMLVKAKEADEVF
jgi:hypothetical protein